MSLEERWKDGLIQVWCDKCGKILVELDEDTRRGWLISDCKHYKWEQVSTLCFYDYDAYPEECDPQYIKELRSRYILRVDSGESLFLLVPRDEGEGEEK
jgi:hypothetical protein